jgi:subtilisin family serine protease
MKLTQRRFGHSAAALTAGLFLGLACAASNGAESLGRAPIDPSAGQVEVFVRLSTPAVSELNAQAIEATGAMASSADQRAQAARVSAEQAAFRAQIAGLGAEELSALRVGANGLRMRVAANQVANLRSLAGVVSVGRVEIHTIDNVESVPWIGALRAAQNFGLTGKGIRIGIIDTGIDYLHANFRKDGVPGDYAGNNKSIIEPGTFPTAKVVGGWDFVGPIYDARTDANPANDLPQPDPDPLDGNGHGSHVSGTAAGFGVAGSIGPGVAPDALLYALKVFNDTSGSTDVTSDAIEWAMDPNGDGDMSDHLDVINMSLGSPFGEPADPSAIASNNAVKVGIVVVASAGNEGDVPYITGAPAVAARAISTAATTPGGRVYSRVNVTAPANLAGFKNNLEGAGPVQLKNAGPISAGVVEAVPLNGCFPDPANPPTPANPAGGFLHQPLTNAAAVSGKIALIRRGTCGFIDKYLVAQLSGAKAILVFNDGANSTRIAPIVMGGLDNSVTIPGVMISSTDGNAINVAATTAADSPVTVTLDAAPDATRDDQVAGFSSRGPGSGGESGFKPDLAAPGVAIVSTGVGTGTGNLNLQGTSMAAPHATGAAALLREEHPELRPGAIKALLQNSTVNGNPSSDTSLARLGVGVIRVDKAAALSSYASPGGISFGRLNPRTPVTVFEDVKLTNMSRNSRTFSVTHVPHTTYPGVTVTCPSSVSVSGRRDRTFSVRLRFDPAASAAAGAFDQASVSQTEVDGWCVLNDGKDSLRVGYLAVVDAASGMQVKSSDHSGGIDIRNRGPAVGFAEGFTLAPRDREWSNGGHDRCDKDRWGPRDHGWNDDSDDQSSGQGNHGDDASSDDGDSCLIARLGVRRADPNFYFGFNVVEFGVVLNKTYEHISNLNIDLFLDTDKDGVDDVQLVARDWSSLSATGVIGTYVSAQFVVGDGGFLDWIVGGWDFNDRVAILPFTADIDGGLVPSSFNYRLVVTNRQGEVDTQTGSIDLANEIKPDLNSFGLDAGTNAHITVSGGHGPMLWLFPTNTPKSQDDSVWAKP